MMVNKILNLSKIDHKKHLVLANLSSGKQSFVKIISQKEKDMQKKEISDTTHYLQKAKTLSHPTQNSLPRTSKKIPSFSKNLNNKVKLLSDQPEFRIIKSSFDEDLKKQIKREKFVRNPLVKFFINIFNFFKLIILFIFNMLKEILFIFRFLFSKRGKGLE